jgi:hypothetical protein
LLKSPLPRDSFGGTRQIPRKVDGFEARDAFFGEGRGAHVAAAIFFCFFGGLLFESLGVEGLFLLTNVAYLLFGCGIYLQLIEL